MRWGEGRRSDNVEDRRGIRVSRGMVGGGVGTIVLLLVSLYLGIDPTFLLQQAPTVSVPPTGTSREARPAEENRLADFISVVLADTEDTWRDLFRRGGNTYREPKLVLFTDAAESACGFAESAVGPFYCPRDQKVYIDLGFYRELKDRFHAEGDFAQAYVIAHEIGHHVQNLLGIAEKVNAARQRLPQVQANALSVKMELQADCYAGVWAKRSDQSGSILEDGDIAEGLNAASAIGDDRLQRRSQGRVVPESFTHGTSAQRVGWFKRGYDGGDMTRCDTFSASRL